MSRKIVQISSSGYSDKGDRREALYALDDEGKVWIIDPYQSEMQWSELPDLPPKAKGVSMLDVP